MQFDAVVAQLRDERDKTQAQLDRLDQAIATLSGVTNPSFALKARRRRTLSPAARKRIAEAQRRRWAGVRARAGKAARARRELSAASRARIVAAQRARWAKYRKQKKAARA